MQKALIHSGKPENRKLVLEALAKTGRMDLADTLLGGDGLTPSGHVQERAKRGGYVGPAYLAGGDTMVDADEAALDEDDGHFPTPRPEDVSWKGAKKTATIKPHRARGR